MSGAVETALDPQAQAEKRTAEMWAEDTASKAMGMELLDVGPGFARMRMPVREV